VTTGGGAGTPLWPLSRESMPKQFVPLDAATAATCVGERYLWNSGNLLFHAATMLGEIERFEPAMAEAAKAAVAGLTRDLDFLRLASEPFARAPKKSIDYAVMQRTRLAAVVPTDLGWSDIGSWSSVWDVLDHDAAGNATDGPVVMLDSRNSLVRSEESVLTTVVGLDDVIVVATGDAVLVSARAKAEQVKTLVEQLKAHNHRAAVEHRRIYRPWGYYQDVDAAPRYRVKRIVVKPGSTLSLQKHFHRSEHWVVVKGTAEITLGNDVRSVHENESVYIPIGSIHRLANPGKISLELIEVQVGSYLGEDDIVRLDDVYGRGWLASATPAAEIAPCSPPDCDSTTDAPGEQPSHRLKILARDATPVGTGNRRWEAQVLPHFRSRRFPNMKGGFCVSTVNIVSGRDAESMSVVAGCRCWPELQLARA
jgi:mannose-6-phosphate isomerase-like protein (cupin superfamily)